MRYRYPRYSYTERRNPLRFLKPLALLSLLLLSIYLLYIAITGRPVLKNPEALGFLPLKSEKILMVSPPAREVVITAEQNGKKIEIFKGEKKEGSEKWIVPIDAQKLGLKEGRVKLTVELSSGFLRKRSYQLDSFVDLTPPPLEVVAYSRQAQQGGVVAVGVFSEEGAKLMARVEGKEYEFYPLGKGRYFLMLPVHVDAIHDMRLEITAQDQAGNVSREDLIIKIVAQKFKEDKLKIDETFVKEAILPLLGEEGKGLDPITAFKKVNEEWRRKNVEKLAEIGSRSEPKKLWEGAFLQLRNSKVLATYGDVRYYYYQDQLVSSSRHMGYDFASVERAPVEASNNGVVVFTGPLGIYGNTVVIDHGLGLMSLYGHLSSIQVKEGQYVRKGDIIGRTGKTGLALGDHLHFGILVQGYEVNPLPWLDEKWLKNHVESVLEALR
ncbi:Peptidase M23 [Thermocrinis albus DSM 14484]|uniref:Peptidase M23 n=1 Tax=Thermocrinis albus (strain DSM 14484 / JCM 11386 / HI 11/12) TaxID=638303 RepID=D3SNG2_THEAH|nr:M23 family metallopeptidase [Thermocrinis albus]ADC88699.1 Peptidase M23 [Thermocrinis albus DSM 14484]